MRGAGGGKRRGGFDRLFLLLLRFRRLRDFLGSARLRCFLGSLLPARLGVGVVAVLQGNGLGGAKVNDDGCEARFRHRGGGAARWGRVGHGWVGGG